MSYFIKPKLKSRTLTGTKSSNPVYLLGGGVIGLSIAIEALRRGYRVALIEKNQPGYGAGWASAGMLAPTSEALAEENLRSELYRFSVENVKAWPEWARFLKKISGVEIDLNRKGTLYPCLDEGGETEQRLTVLEKFNLSYACLNQSDLHRYEPSLSKRVKKAWYFKGDIQLHPRRLMAALKTAFFKLGGQFIRAELIGIKTKRECLTELRLKDLSGETKPVLADRLILASGASDLSGLQVSFEPGLYPVKGHMFSVLPDKTRPFLRHIIRTKQVYIAPKSTGEIICGSTTEVNCSDNRIDAEKINGLYEAAVSLLPGLALFPLHEKWTGVRPARQSHYPIIGPIGIKGVFAALGHYRAGVTQSPLTAAAACDWLDECFDEEALRAFKLDERPVQNQASLLRSGQNPHVS